MNGHDSKHMFRSNRSSLFLLQEARNPEGIRIHKPGKKGIEHMIKQNEQKDGHSLIPQPGKKKG